MRAFDASLRRLGLDYLDLYLLHWPLPKEFDATVASYEAARKLLADGRVRAIGVCNFKRQQLNDLVGRTEVVPAVNQVELHPYFTQRDVRDADADRDVVTQSWSPIGGAILRHAEDPSTAENVLTDPTIVELAAKHHKTPAQIVLRWHIDHGLSAIPKSVRPQRIAENIDIFDFALSADEIAAIDALNSGVRAGPDPDQFDASKASITVED